jgi:adenylate cyclase
MADDEHATLDTLTSYRQLFTDRVTRREGRIVDSPGDAILAEFPSAVEAVQCAVELQQELKRRNAQLAEHRRMPFRIGINLGDVIEEGGAIYGDGVNVAARLQALVEPGGVCISGTVFDQVEGKLSLHFTFLGEQQVKNIPKPVRAYQLASTLPKPAAFGRGRGRRTILAVAVIVAVGLGAVLYARFFRPGGEMGLPTADPVLSMPKGPSIAVLPFSNLTGDLKQDALADGITEDIITALSRFPDLFVIARNSTLKYKGKPPDIRDVGKDLGVRFVLEGSVQGAKDRLRITAQLIDSTTGAHVWADTFNREITNTNLLDVQDDITQRVAAQVAGGYGVLSRLGTAQASGTRAADLDAYACVLKARAYYRVFTPTEHLEARNCLETIVGKYPNYSEALAWLALMYLDEFRYKYNVSPDRPHPLDTALEFAERAVHAAPTDQYAQHALAKVHYFRGETDQFFIRAEKALALNPNNVQALSDLGFFTAFAGRWDRGVPMVRKAATLDPSHPGWYHFVFFYDHYRKHEYEQALSEALRVDTPGLFFHHVVHAAAYGQLGRKEEAQPHVRALLKMYPDYPNHMREEYRKYRFSEELIEHLAEGLAKAGLPIPDDRRGKPGANVERSWQPAHTQA